MIDWQSYLDGTMPEAERTALEGRLAQEPALKAELDGYQAFSSEITRQGQSEAIPYERLHAVFDKIVAPVSPRPNILRPVFAMALALVVFVIATMLARDPNALAQSPYRASVAVSNPEHAAAWVYNHTDFNAPLVPMKGTEAKLIKAQYGAGWASYEYRLGGNNLTLYFADRSRRSVKKLKLGRITSHGVAWESHKLSFYLVGPRPALDKVMSIAMTESKKPYVPDPAACKIME